MATSHALAQQPLGATGPEQHVLSAVPSGAPGFLALERAQAAACSALANTRWPNTAAGRRAHLQRLESARPQCIQQADLLAALGALWLEEGEAAQALVWLERALLLEPGHLGAVADHALALAALGEPAALNELSKAWATRTDVPQALRSRISRSQSLITTLASLPAVRFGQPNTGQWVQYREVTTLLGFETNLTHSPRLAEITLTQVDGPTVFTLASPYVPQRGFSALTDLSWQFATSPSPGQVWRFGVTGGARATPRENKTDWHHVQWAASASQQWAPWRGQLEISGTSIGGPLSEPYRLLRTSASLERNALGCTLRAGLDLETRKQGQSSVYNGTTYGGSWSNQCPLPSNGGWTWGTALRTTVDHPQNTAEALRPGGTQRLASLGARLQGPVSPGLRLDVSLRYSRIRDDEGYFPLFEDGARRELRQTQWSVELVKPLQGSFIEGAEALLQVQDIRQSSNLSLFRYTGFSIYSGIRWAW